MKKKYGLVLEGGAVRGLFGAGVLDYFMEKNIVFPYVVGVSAGAFNAMSYISGQIERSKNCITYDGDDCFYGKNVLKNSGRIIDMSTALDGYSYSQFPFDFASYFSSGIEREYAVTSLLDGKTYYLGDQNEEKRLLSIVKASSSMPITSSPVYIEGVPYLDGSVSDPVPVKRAFLKGCQKCVIILTKPEEYSSKQPFNVNAATGILYRKYPEFLDVYQKRKETYASRMKLVSYLERAGMAYVIRPEIPAIDRLETDRAKQNEFYAHGYELAERKYEDVLHFLGEDKIIYNA